MIKEFEEMSPGDRLRELIRRSGYTQEEFAKLAGMTRPTLQRKLNEASFDANLAQNAARILSIDVNVILGKGSLPGVSEPQAPYGKGGSVEDELRAQIAFLQEQIRDMSVTLHQKGKMNLEMLEIIKRLTSKE